MKQVEITVRVKENLDEVINKLEKQGFKKTRESDIDDIYMTQIKNELKKDNIRYILANCVLLRSFTVDGEKVSKLTYKNKEYDKGRLISEKKVNVDCNDLESAQKLFEYLKFEKLVEVKYHVIVVEKDGIEFAFQDVENLGLLMEYESLIDFENKSINDIKIEKQRMYDFIKQTGLKITDEQDVQKAYELVNKNLN